jgi:simple sugar transport system ATP-binding protein
MRSSWRPEPNRLLTLLPALPTLSRMADPGSAADPSRDLDPPRTGAALSETPASAPADSPPLLEARSIWKSFGGVDAVRDVSIEFPAGTVTALVGDNGAGKSTLIKMLSGVIRPDRGHLEVDGAPVVFETPAVARGHGVETVYQDLALADHRDVAENLFMGRELVRALGPMRFIDQGGMRRQTETALAELNVKIPSVRQQVRRLSGGQRQAIAIARAVHWGSRILIMDEPMAALGLQEASRVQELSQTLAARGLTQIIVSHNLDHVFSLSTRIAVMRLGRLVGIRETAQTGHEAIVRLVAGLDRDPVPASP